MAEMWKPKGIEIWKDWIYAIEDVSDTLTAWETNFIDSISVRIHNGRNLTQAQEEILERIYVEKTK